MMDEQKNTPMQAKVQVNHESFINDSNDSIVRTSVTEVSHSQEVTP